MTRNKKTRNKKTRNKRSRFIQNKSKKNMMQTKYGGASVVRGLTNFYNTGKSAVKTVQDTTKRGKDLLERGTAQLKSVAKDFKKNQIDQSKTDSETGLFKNLGKKDISGALRGLTYDTGKSTKDIISNLSGSQSKYDKEIQKKKAEIKDIKNKTPSNVTDIQNLEKEIEDLQRKSKNDVSIGLRKFGEGVATFGEGLFSSKKSKFSNKEKNDIIKKLGELKTKKQLNKNEYDLLIEYLNQKSMTDSIGNNAQSLQNSVQAFVANAINNTLAPSGNSTALMTHAMIPNLYEKYNKMNVTESENKMEEPIFFVEESHSNMGHQLTANLNSVDNFLAKILNECIGAGCKNGKDIVYKTTNKTKITNNVPIKN